MIRQINTNADELLNRAQVAAMLGIAEHTLACWRSEGRGPAVVKFGAGRSAAVRYRRSDVAAWIADPVACEAAAREPWREERRKAIASTKGAKSKDRRCARARA